VAPDDEVVLLDYAAPLGPPAAETDDRRRRYRRRAPRRRLPWRAVFRNTFFRRLLVGGLVGLVAVIGVRLVGFGSASSRVRPPPLSPSMVGGCLDLIHIGADALGVDVDSYARVLVATTQHDGRTLQAAVREQLEKDRAFLAHQLEDRTRFAANTDLIIGVNAVGATIQRLTATTCP
jgi:hypothetical protein